MPKIRLKKQDKYEFKYRTTLQVSHMNYGGHLGNDSLVTIIHEARTNLLKDLGLSELDLGDGKTGIIMADLGVNYLEEAFLFDKLNVLSHVDEIRTHSFRVFYNLRKSRKTIALAETGIITFDYSDRRIAEIPQAFLDALDNYINKEQIKTAD